MDPFVTAIGLAFVGFILIGILMSRAVRNKADYFVAGRAAGVLLIVGTLAASYLSTVAMMGEAGMAYDGFPWPVLMLTTTSQLGYVAGVLLFGRYLRGAQTLTIPEFFGRRFNSPRLHILSGLMVLVGIGLYLVAVTRGISLVFETLTGIGGFWAVLITWVVFSAFTILSGSKGVIVTDTLMFLIFVLGGGAGFLSIIHHAGGITEVFQSLAQDPATREGLLWHGAVSSEGATLVSRADSMMYIITFGVVWFIVLSVSPWQASRYMMARTTHTAVRAGFVTLCVVTIFYVFMLFSSYTANLINPALEDSSTVLIWSAYNIMPTAIGVTVITGIMSAGLSSASTFLSLVGFSAVNDVAGPLRARARGEAAPARAADPHPAAQTEGTGNISLMGSRVAMLVVGLVALVVTVIATPGVLEIGYMAAAFFAASWGAVAFASTQSRRVTERGAFWSMLVGGVVLLVFESLETFGGLALPALLNPALLGIAASIIALLIGNATGTSDPAALAYITQLKAEVEGQSTPAEVRRTKVYLGLTFAALGLVGLLVALLYIPAMSTTL